MSQKIKGIKQLMLSNLDSPEALEMIDAIQRLGIDHHFKSEIKSILYNQSINDTTNQQDLYQVALRFRLLRQHAHHVSSSVLKSYRDRKVSTKGMVELYEASRLKIEGEDILEEAKDFSREELKARLGQLDHIGANVVRNTLSFPQPKSLARLSTKKELLVDDGTHTWIDPLREIAKTDSALMRSLHQTEILRISKWWDEIGLIKEIKNARDQPAKWYMWSMVALEDPSLSEERLDLTKPISLIYIIDDIYDIIGKPDELALFTQSINRWEFSDQELPQYMRACCIALDEVTNDISRKVLKRHGWNPVQTLRKKWGELCNAFLVEARWFSLSDYPKADEYLKNGVGSSGVPVILAHLYYMLDGKGTTMDAETHQIIYSTGMILRLWDDLGTAKDEDQNGHDGSFLEYYMKENEGISEEMARNHVRKLISEAWARLNKYCLTPSRISANFRKACFDLSLMVPLMYSFDENHSLPLLKEHINLMKGNIKGKSAAAW